MKIEGFRLAIEWCRLDDPPGEKVLAERYVITNGSAPRMPDDFRGLAPLGSGYGYTVRHIGSPTKSMSEEARATVRRKRVARRIRKKYPLFAEEFITEEIKKKEAYYSGITDPRLQQGYDEALRWEREEYEKLLKLGVEEK